MAMILSVFLFIIQLILVIIALIMLFLLALMLCPIDVSADAGTGAGGTAYSVALKMLMGTIAVKYTYPDEMTKLIIFGFSPDFLKFPAEQYFGIPYSDSGLRKIWKNRFLIRDIVSVTPEAIVGIIRSFRLRRIYLNAELALADPGIAGLVTGAGHSLSGLLRGFEFRRVNIRLLSKPENDYSIGEGELEIRFLPGLLIKTIISLLLKKPTRHIILGKIRSGTFMGPGYRPYTAV